MSKMRQRGYVEDWVFLSAVGLLTVAGTLGLIAWAIVASVEECKQWQAFKSAHHCKVTARMTGDAVTSFGVSSNGNPAVTFGSTPDKEGWLCDDGMTYWRDQ